MPSVSRQALPHQHTHRTLDYTTYAPSALCTAHMHKHFLWAPQARCCSATAASCRATQGEGLPACAKRCCCKMLMQLQWHAMRQQAPVGPVSGMPSAQLPWRRRRLRRTPGDASAFAGQQRPFAVPASACRAAAAAADAAIAAGNAPSGAP